VIGLSSLQAMDRAQGARIWMASEATDMRYGFDRAAASSLLPIAFLAMAAKDQNDQEVIFDLADEPAIAYTVFPELSKPRDVQRLSDAARIV
jgi:hypothetical protein